MKNLILAICLILTTSAFAQIERGTLSVGGAISFSQHRSTSESQYVQGYPPYIQENVQSSFSFQPSGGYFLIPNFYVGGTVALLYAKTTFKKGGLDGYSTKRTDYGVGPQAAYYIPLNASFYIVPQASFFWRKSDYTSFDLNQFPNYPEIENSATYTTYQLGVGLSYFVQRHASINLTAQYSKSNSDYALEESSLEAFTLSIGVGFFFRRGTE
jgi:opacity protein-like surface antigen